MFRDNIAHRPCPKPLGSLRDAQEGSRQERRQVGVTTSGTTLRTSIQISNIKRWFVVKPNDKDFHVATVLTAGSFTNGWYELVTRPAKMALQWILVATERNSLHQPHRMSSGKLSLRTRRGQLNRPKEIESHRLRITRTTIHKRKCLLIKGLSYLPPRVARTAHPMCFPTRPVSAPFLNQQCL